MNTDDPKLLLFSGKGGVGKTTCSASIAVRMATKGIRTLHITSDMAPSLGDIYGMDIGDRLTSVYENLDAVEFSQESIARTWKTKFGADFTEILSQFLDTQAMEEDGDLDLLDYIGTAPSLREETLLDMIVEMALEGEYEKIIWDTAPTGETLNLLHMPRLMKKHLKAGARLYEAMDRLAGAVKKRRSLAGIMEEWVVRSEGIARFLQENTMFFIVTNPEALVVRQAERTLMALTEAGFSVQGLIINRIAVSDGSEYMMKMGRNQEPYVKRLLLLGEGLSIGRVNFTLDEIRGIEPLRAIGDSLSAEMKIDNYL